MSPFYCESCDSHVTEDERATCRAVNCPTTPDDKPKLPACPCGKCHCVICGNQMDRDAALVAAEKRIEELATELGRAENEAKRVYGAEIDKLEEQLTAAQAERDALRAQAEALALELEIILSTFESAVHDQYDGTSSLDERLAEMEPARKALAEYRSDK